MMRHGNVNKTKEMKLKKDSAFRASMKRLSKNKVAMVCLAVILIFIILAILAPWVTPYGYADMDLAAKNQFPSLQHWCGTDDLGRDIFTRVLYGGRYSLSISLIAVTCSLILGLILGSLAGFFGGNVETLIMRFLDIFQSIPDLILTIAISAALGSGFDKTVIALCISRMPTFTRILRANIMSVRDNEYVEAATAIGCNKFTVITKFILPNAWTPLIVQATMASAGLILSLAALSYVGLGIQPPTPEWGAMLSAARGNLRDYPYQLIFPGLAIAIIVLCLNMLGDGLRDALDPKLKN